MPAAWGGSDGASTGAGHALTVDVEEWFQVSAYAGVIEPWAWEGLESRVVPATEAVLALLERHGARGTFFVLGWVAQRHPELVRRIQRLGHEVASHGWSHVRATQQSPAEFLEDVTRTRLLLESLIGTPVTGYRATSFSMGAHTPWAYMALSQAGYRYSSSVYPIRHDHHGDPRAPLLPHHPVMGGVVELPVAALPLGPWRLPCGGGGYFRLYPAVVSRWAWRRLEAAGRRGVFYLHPWELDPGQPRVRGASWRSRWRHGLNLERMAQRLETMLQRFHWQRMDRVFAPELTLGGADPGCGTRT
ncbi:MAG: DUF3473 domain-containing protein [Magnetococcus sp. WYHC-3]